MSKKDDSNLPVYFFLGFRLLEGNIKRTGDDKLKSFAVKILESIFTEESSLHVITIQFSMTFENNDESTFIFNSGYGINDMEWYGQLKKEQIDALFFSVMFPYVREKIYSLTNDYRGSVDIPIIDLRHADLTKGATFHKNTNLK